MTTRSYANRRVLLDHHIRTVEAGDWLFFRGHHRAVKEVTKANSYGEKYVIFADGLSINVGSERFDGAWIPEILRLMPKFRPARSR